MRLTRSIVALAVAGVTVLSLAGQAAAGPASRTATTLGSVHAGSALSAREATELADVMLVARSSGAERQRALAAVMQAATTGPVSIIPTPGSLTGLDGSCTFDQSGGSFSESSSGSDVAAAASRDVLGELIPVGHLTGASGTDVLDYRLGEKGSALSTGITARSARTGAALWSRKMQGAKDEFSVPFPDVDRVGPTHQRGLLLVTESAPLFSNGTKPATLTVTAVSGAGKTLWTKTLTGSVTSSQDGETDTDVPVVVGDLDRGASHGLLIEDETASTSFSTFDESGTIQPEVMSASDGTVTPLGSPVTSTVGVPAVTPVPDLNKDGIDDVVLTVPGSHGSGHVIAENGKTGAVIWTTAGLAINDLSVLSPIGHISGAQTEDLVLDTIDESSPRVDRGLSNESLIDGRTGKALWTHSGACVFDIGRAGAHRRPAVGEVTVAGNTVSGKTSTTRVTLVARTVTGSVIYRKSVVATVTAKKAVHSESDEEDLTPFPDVQPDGATDLLVKVSATVGKTTARKTVLISGRNGAAIADPIGLPTQGSLQHGAGADLVKEFAAASSTKLLTVAGYDAATGKQFYRRSIKDTRYLKSRAVYGVRVTGHDCSDLVINAEGKAGYFIGLFDAKAQPLWSIRTGDHLLTGGHVTRAPAPTSYCVGAG